MELCDIKIDEILDIKHNQISSRVERWTYERSGWTIDSIIQHQLVISEITPCEESFYFPLPKELRNPMRGLINSKNEDSESFRWCLVRYLNPANKNPAKIRNVDREFAKQLNSKGVKVPVYKKDYPKVEKQNSSSINVFDYEDETLYHIYTSKQTFEEHIDLSLLSNSKNSQYITVKNIF